MEKRGARKKRRGRRAGVLSGTRGEALREKSREKFRLIREKLGLIKRSKEDGDGN